MTTFAGDSAVRSHTRQTAAGTFYGLQTLKQLVRGDAPAAFLPGVQIVDWPQMRWRAPMRWQPRTADSHAWRR